jgi:CMP/dCMP kinase
MAAENTNRPFIVAIDGPAGSGKTTTARALAERLGFLYVDTGAMYRAMGYAAVAAGIPFSDTEAICALVPTLDIRLEIVEGAQKTILNGRDIETEIRTQAMSKAASDVSAIPCVREAMVELQRSIALASKGAILEGRDIGTVVFPGAPCKIYLVADVRTRAFRRKLQLEEAGLVADLEVIEREIAERDRNDMTRDHSPLRKAIDAFEVETTNITIEEQVSKIHALVLRRLERLGERA